MKNKFPGFKKCLAMMRKRDAQTQEEGFHTLLPHAFDNVFAMIQEFRTEKDHGLQCWLLELIGSAKSPDAFAFLADQLRSKDRYFQLWAIWGLKRLDTKEARTLLWEARSWTFETLEATTVFRSLLDADLNRQAW